MAAGVLQISVGDHLFTYRGEFMARPPNYKQDKKRREEAQKRRNEQEQLRKAERKNKDAPVDPPPQ
jgi:hypothetical protein